MKKVFIPMMALILCVGSLIACGKNIAANENIPCDIYDTGEFKVTVPEGWHVFPVTDPFAEGRPIKTDCLFLRKGGESDWRVSEKPYIRIAHYDYRKKPEQSESNEKTHRNLEKLEPFKLGDLVWSGYTADSFHGKANIGRFADLWAECDGHVYQALVWFKSGGESIKLSDPDVKLILAGLYPGGTVKP